MLMRPYLKRLQPHDISAKAASTPFFTARQLANIYGFPQPNTSLKPVVGVLSFGGGLYGSIDAQGVLTNGDVQKYWAYQGITAMPKVIVKTFDGATNDVSDATSTIENTMDVGVVGACCPSSNLTILLFIFPNPYTFTQAFQTVLGGITSGGVLYKPTIISVSWGAPELWYLENGADVTGDLTGTNNILTAATHLGVNICVAAGDHGATDNNGTAQLSCDFPASCPNVTAVGGTTLTCPNGVYDSQTVETVWNDGVVAGSFYATGGGVSTFFAKPAYQKSVSGTMRGVPDIALDSDPDTGISLHINGSLQLGFGGTSMAAPMFAGYLAAIGPTNFVNPALYSASAAQCFRDIKVGCNFDAQTDGFRAGTGYDFCSGLGSIVGGRLATALLPPATSLSLLPKSPITVMLSDKTVALSATVLPVNASNSTLTWTSSNTGVASVSASSGIVTLVSAGTATITVSTTDGSRLSASVSIIVTVMPSNVLASSVLLNPKSLTLTVGQTGSFQAVISPANTTNKGIAWYSSNTRIISVNQYTGVITAVRDGVAYVGAVTTDGSKKSVVGTVAVTKKLGLIFK